MVSEFVYERRVQFAETDAAGILHFANYHRFMEEAEHAFLRSLGLSVHMTLEGRDVGFPRLATRCEFVRPVGFEDVLRIELRVARVGRSSVTYQFVFRHDEQTVARGEAVVACAELGAGGALRKMPLPRAFTDRVDATTLGPVEFRDGARTQTHPRGSDRAEGTVSEE